MEITRTSSEEQLPEPPIGWADALGPDVENPPEARTHGRQLIEPESAGGKTHTVASCEMRIKGQFELWVQNNALRAIAAVEATGDLERADKMTAAYTGDFAAGHYSWDGKYVRNARFQSMPGIVHLLYLLMVRCDKSKTEEQVRDLMTRYPRQCGELIRWALGNSPSPAESGGNGKDPRKTAEPRILNPD